MAVDQWKDRMQPIRRRARARRDAAAGATPPPEPKPKSGRSAIPAGIAL
jgi:hypothetical protein